MKCVDELQLNQFNDNNDFDIDVMPGLVFDELQAFNAEYCNDKMKVEVYNKKDSGDMSGIRVTIPEDEAAKLADEWREAESKPSLMIADEAERFADDGEQVKGISVSGNDIVAKVRFYRDENDAEGRTRVRFARKQGNMITW